MKILFAFLLTFNWWGAAQDISIPQAARRVEFADVSIKLTPQAQDLVNAQIRTLLTPDGEYLNRKIEKMQWYFPIIEQILEEEGVPDDFKYVAVLESALEPNAVSTSNAVGFWQFKHATAQEMGLRMDGEVDERKEVFQATRAAANYLKRNNLLFNNWVTALLTYNLGAGGVSGKIPSDWNYAKEITFDQYTHPYLMTALANRIAYEHRINRLRDSDYRFVVYPTKGKSLNDIAKSLVVDVNDLQKYNAWLVGSGIPSDKNYNVLVPVRTTQAAELEKSINNRQDIAKLDVGFPQLERISPENVAPNEPILYKINGRKGILAEPGLEIPQLAAKAKVGVYKFLRYNDMTERDQIESGKVYYLQKKSRKAKVPYHTVAEGETMADIAHMYGVQMKQLLKMNRLKSVQRLQAGRVVWLQKKRPKNQPIEFIEEATPNKSTPSERDVVTQNTSKGNGSKVLDRSQSSSKDTKISESDDALNDIFKGNNGSTTPNKNTPTNNTKPATHFVQQGETLYSISKKYNVTVGDLQRWNGLSPTGSLQFNQRLIVSEVAAANENRSTTPSSTYSQPTSTASAQYHSVAAGETLYRISKNYGVTVELLRAWNNLSDNTISVGQRLKVTESSSSATSTSTYSQPSSTASAQYHSVAAGETLYRISKNYGVTVEQLRAWNNLPDNTISVGQRLIIRK